MNRFKILCIFLFLFLIHPSVVFPALTEDDNRFYFSAYKDNTQDTTLLNQVLYNGRTWIGLYFNVHGTEFIFTKDWLEGSVTINGLTFSNLSLKYDIYNDCLLANYRDKSVVILNSESVDNFNLKFNNRYYNFIKLSDNNSLSGYVEVYYDGNIKLYKKWKKKRAQFAIEAKYDEFQPDDALFIEADGNTTRISNKRSFLKVLDGKDNTVKDFIRRERIRIDISDPETLIPVMKFYDSLTAR